VAASTLIEVEDGDFEWLRDPVRAPRLGLRLAPGGIHPAPVMDIVRDMTRDLHRAGCRASWMICVDGEVVGMCSFRRPPENGAVEIGYGIADSRQRQGLAGRAVEQVIAIVADDAAINRLTAETAVSNPASGKVLAKNGFDQVGTRYDDEDGDLILWERLV
jgi:RimJ/RimL family protein N-acetyltransferase